MELCERSEAWQRSDIHQLFTKKTVAKSDRDMVAGWLIKRFEADPDSDDQLGMCIWENAVPSITEDLIRLIHEPRYGHHRAALCQALAKTKDSRAAAVLASVMDEPNLALWCLSALGKTAGARLHISKIKKHLHAGNGEVRREARKLLGKLGVPIEKTKPPTPDHLVKSTRSVPIELEEWSTNLDEDELEATLQKVSECVGKGFANTEIAEVLSVVEAMKVGQTKAFRFPISANREKSELWVVVFMDDVGAPDIEIHASAKNIRNISKSTGERTRA
jgi:hypothetical protein